MINNKLYNDRYIILMMKENRNYVGIMIEDEENRVLFQLRDNKPNIPHPNKWSLFGGGIEQGERPEEAIISAGIGFATRGASALGKAGATAEPSLQ